MAIEYSKKCDEVYMICDICGHESEDELFEDDETGELYCEDCLFKRFKRIDYDRAWEIAMEEEAERKAEAEARYRDAEERYREAQEEIGKCISKGISY